MHVQQHSNDRHKFDANITTNTVFYRVTHDPLVTHSNTKILQISTINNSVNMAPIDDALAVLKSLQLGEEPNLTQVAEKYGYNGSTLSKRCLRLNSTKDQKSTTSQQHARIGASPIY
jgi:hypothetical protein